MDVELPFTLLAGVSRAVVTEVCVDGCVLADPDNGGERLEVCVGDVELLVPGPEDIFEGETGV